MANEKEPKLMEVVKEKSIQDQLLELQLKREQKQFAEEEEKEVAKKASHLAGMRAMQNRREQELAKQSQCGHKKPYGESALVGQRLHSHKHLYLCQYCSKEWFDAEVPLDLRISADMVGGPI